jgi:hypothetical protein
MHHASGNIFIVGEVINYLDVCNYSTTVIAIISVKNVFLTLQSQI